MNIKKIEKKMREEIEGIAAYDYSHTTNRIISLFYQAIKQVVESVPEVDKIVVSRLDAKDFDGEQIRGELYYEVELHAIKQWKKKILKEIEEEK